MALCIQCGIEFEATDPLGSDLCDACCEAQYMDDDDLEYDNAYADESCFPEFDWMAALLE